MWTIDATDARSAPGKLELGSQVVGLHFSPHCKELLSTLGTSTSTEYDRRTWLKNVYPNSVAVHSCPSLRHVTSLSIAEKTVGGSVMNANSTKVFVTVPEENKLRVLDVWGKRKEVRRQSSLLYTNTIR